MSPATNHFFSSNGSDVANKLVEMLADQTKFKPLLEWVEQSLECNESIKIPNQGFVASAFLLELRNTCRPFFESPAFGASSLGQGQRSAFPPLPASTQQTANGSEDTQTTKKREKRRIRPSKIAAISTSTDSFGSVGNLVGVPSGCIETDSYPPLKGTNSTIPTTRPTGNFRPSNTKAVAGSVQKPTPWNVPKSDASMHCDARAETSLVNCALLYNALWDNLLIPSTAAEIKFLLQCLSLPDSPINVSSGSGSGAFQSFLSASQQCHRLAVEVLKQRSAAITRISTLIPNLAQCELLRDRIPSLSQALVTPPNPATPVATAFSKYQTVQLTIPFDPKRDSRHNFKSQNGQALFTNRETCRDDFTEQLRSFLHLKGSLLNAVEQDRSLHQLRKSAAELVHRVMMDGNSSWFAEVFCELLLQVGNVPIQETDSEVLSKLGGDNVKVQKLHERFSSKVTSPRGHGGLIKKNTSRHKNRGGQHNGSTSPMLAAMEYFPGHQEFFYLFLTASNHFSVQIHLRSLLATKLKESNELSINDKCMLARFLGLLLFSPNWSLTHEGAPLAHKVDGIQELDALGLPLLAILGGEHSWESIPFIVELLVMSQWDVFRLKSVLFRRVVSYLWRHHFHIQRNDANAAPIIQLHLEYFFGEVLDLSMSLSIVKNSKITFDPLPLQHLVIEGLTSAAVPAWTKYHLTGLESLLNEMGTKDSRGDKPKMARKLRPSVVAISPSVEASTRSTTTFGASSEPFLVELQDSFFHNHGDLKQVCEFVARRVLREVEARIREEYTARPIASITSSEEPAVLRRWYTEKGFAILEDEVQKRITSALRVLVSSSFKTAVVDEASVLTTTHCYILGKDSVERLATLEVEQISATFGRLQKKGNKNSKTKAEIVSTSLIGVTSHLQSLNVLLSRPHVTLCSGKPELEKICVDLEESIDNYTKDQEDNVLPSEALTYEFFQATTELGASLEPFLLQIAPDDGDEGDARNTQNLALELLHVSIRLAAVSCFLRSRVLSALKNPVIANLITAGDDSLDRVTKMVSEIEDSVF